jgi:4-amino-4-deoxy-L-arabinose transferase-like glycosyltransferase
MSSPVAQFKIEVEKRGKLFIFLLLLVFLLGIVIRLYDLKDPPLDFHLERQLRSAVISRAAYYRMDTALNPQLRAQAVNLAQLEVYEPPILEQIVGFTYYAMGSEQVWVARLWLTLFWLIGGVALYKLGRKFASPLAVLLGLAFYFFLPFGVIASRSFQPDSWMVMWILLTALALYKWSETPTWKWAVTAGLLGGVTLLVKVVAGFYVGSMLAAVGLATLGLRKGKVFRSGQIWAMIGIMVIPAGVYYLLFNGQRSADFMSFWTISLLKLIFTSNFYAQWLAMIKGLMGLTNLLAALLGVILAPRKAKPVLIGAWIGYLLYGLVFPYQYITHEYYHLPLVALVAISLTPLVDVLIQHLKDQAVVWRLAAVGVILFTSGYSLWVARSILYASNYCNEPAAWQKVGEAIPQDASFVGLTADYGMRVRYYGWRSMSVGWPTGIDIKLFTLAGKGQADFASQFKGIAAGKDYFLVTAFSELDAQPQLKDYLQNNFPVYKQGDGYVLYDLKHPLRQ